MSEYNVRTDSIRQQLEAKMRDLVGEKLAELTGLPSFLAMEKVCVEIEDILQTDEDHENPGLWYFPADIYVDHPLKTGEVPLLKELRRFMNEEISFLNVGGTNYFLNISNVFEDFDHGLQETVQIVNDELTSLFNAAASDTRILVTCEKTAENYDIFVVKAGKAGELSTNIRESAAEIIERALDSMEDRPRTRCDGSFPELNLEWSPF